MRSCNAGKNRSQQFLGYVPHHKKGIIRRNLIKIVVKKYGRATSDGDRNHLTRRHTRREVNSGHRGVAGNEAAGTYTNDAAEHGVAGTDSRLVAERLAPLPQETHSQTGNTTGYGETKHRQEGVRAPRT